MKSLRFHLTFNFRVPFIKPDKKYQTDKEFTIQLVFEEVSASRGDVKKVLEVLKKYNIQGEIVEVPVIRLF